MIRRLRAGSLIAAGAVSMSLVAALAACGTSEETPSDSTVDIMAPSVVSFSPTVAGLSTRDFCGALPRAAEVKNLGKLSVQEPQEIFRMGRGDRTEQTAATVVRCLYLKQGASLADDPFGGKMGSIVPGSLRVEFYTDVTDVAWNLTILEGMKLLMGEQDGPATPADLGDAAKFTDIMSVTDLQDVFLTVRKGTYAIQINTGAPTPYDDLVKLARAVLATL